MILWYVYVFSFITYRALQNFTVLLELIMCESKHQLCCFKNAGSHSAKILIPLPRIFLTFCHQGNAHLLQKNKVQAIWLLAGEMKKKQTSIFFAEYKTYTKHRSKISSIQFILLIFLYCYLQKKREHPFP